VLSRCLDLDIAEPESPFMLFQKACERYPRMFISLVSTL
jgi:isochorismate synthase